MCSILATSVGSDRYCGNIHVPHAQSQERVVFTLSD